MPGPYRRKKVHGGDEHASKKTKTKRRTKDIDQIDHDLKEENAKALLNQEIDLDKTGNAQHYCLHWRDTSLIMEH